MAYASVLELTNQLAADGAASFPDTPTADRLLEEASQDIDSHCRRDFTEHDGEAVHLEGGDKAVLILPPAKTPVLSVDSITVDGETLSLSALWIKSSGVITGHVFPAGSHVVVTLDYGYKGDPPAAIHQACLKLASRKWRHDKSRERVAEGLKSETIEGYSVTFDPLDMDRDVTKLLEPYRVKRAAR